MSITTDYALICVALLDAVPGIQMSESGGVITFYGDALTQAEVDDAVATHKALVIATQYKNDRDYGSIGDQLDMIYWDQVNETTTFKDHVGSVKSAHPKPA